MNIVSKKMFKGFIRVFVMSALLSLSGCIKSCPADVQQPVSNNRSISPQPHPCLRRPRVPVTLQPLMHCIYTYQDVIDVLGSSRVVLSEVILAGGAEMQPGRDLAYIAYEAIPLTQSNSIFDSKLSAEWRWPGGNWQLSTANVWTLGCVYQQAGQPPYTNLIKGGDTIMINTCFYWSTNEHTGERVDYLVVD